MKQLQLTFNRPARVKRITVHQRRATKRELVEQFFATNVGVRFASVEMHVRFGTAFRTRVSEINRNAGAAIVIRNLVQYDDAGHEISRYWAEPK
jgi:hypothetical protein